MKALILMKKWIFVIVATFLFLSFLWSQTRVGQDGSKFIDPQIQDLHEYIKKVNRPRHAIKRLNTVNTLAAAATRDISSIKKIAIEGILREKNVLNSDINKYTNSYRRQTVEQQKIFHTPEAAFESGKLPTQFSSKKETNLFEKVYKIVLANYSFGQYTQFDDFDDSGRKGFDNTLKKYTKYQHELTNRLFPISNDKYDRILNQINYNPKQSTNSRMKKIFMYNGLDNDMVSGQSRFLKHECPINRCLLTDRNSDRYDADLIFFKDYAPASFPNRRSDQIWLLFTLESPVHTGSFSELRNTINWTATYRKDSVLNTPYERFTYFNNTSVTSNISERNFAAGRSKKVAWMVSNCFAINGRQEYAHELSKYIEVDIFGACGEKQCDRSDRVKCDTILKNNYKFYLSFENSNCRHYITEKLYWNALNNDILPIVMGAHPEDYKHHLPPNSYIHVDDFESPQKLAEYLHLLDNDDNLYNSYFKWKSQGEYIDTKFWCRLCAMIHAQHKNHFHMVYTDLEEWWRGDNVCVSPSYQPWASWKNIPYINKKKFIRTWRH